MLTPRDKIGLIKLFYQGNSARRTRDIWLERNPEQEYFDHSQVLRVIRKFERDGTVHDKRKRVAIERQNVPRQQSENERNILNLVERDPTLTLRGMSQQLNVSKSLIHKVLKKNKFKSYHYTNHQQLLDSDYQRRVFFSSTMIDLINNDRNLLENICFSDESCFTLRHAPNWQNSRMWAKNNPSLVVQSHTQFQQKVNVWIGILGANLIGPFFYNENLTGELFLDLLMNEIGPRIAEVGRDGDIWFQMDGCPAHNTRIVKEYLHASFPGRLIAHNGDIDWSARSPDLSPNDYFLWGHISSIIYNGGKSYANVDDLKDAIRQVCNNINARQLKNVRNEFYHRLGYCVAADGGIFENLI